MAELSGFLSADQMKQLYGEFFESRPRLTLDRNNVPKKFWPLLPYAAFWGLADDSERASLIKAASPEVRSDLKRVIQACDNELDEWLAGPEADSLSPSDEYVAFSAMRMAGYCI